MDQQFSFIFQFFPAIVFGVISLNALIWWIRGKSVRREFPGRITSYKRLISWFVLYCAGICLFAQLEIIFSANDYIAGLIEAQEIRAFGWIALVLIFSISPLLALYTYRFNGAKELADHPGLLYSSNLPISETLFWQCMPIIIFVVHAGFLMNLFVLINS